MVIELETQLNASFPDPGDREKLRLITNDVGKNHLGVRVKEENGKYLLQYPIYIYVGQKK